MMRNYIQGKYSYSNLSDSDGCSSNQSENFCIDQSAVWCGLISSTPAWENNKRNAVLCGTVLPDIWDETISAGDTVIKYDMDFSKR